MTITDILLTALRAALLCLAASATFTDTFRAMRNRKVEYVWMTWAAWALFAASMGWLS